MLGAFLYYALTVAESALGVFGIRTGFEQPRYEVLARLPQHVEIRRYAPRLAVQTDIGPEGEGAAFGRLFRYITGANVSGARIAMTAPVEDRAARIAMTVPVERGARTMRFFLPRSYTAATAPRPTDARVAVVALPARDIAALRYSGIPDPGSFAQRRAELLTVLAAAGRHAEGTPYFLGYDPPFAIPFLRRNEVAVELAPDTVPSAPKPLDGPHTSPS